MGKLSDGVGVDGELLGRGVDELLTDGTGVEVARVLLTVLLLVDVGVVVEGVLLVEGFTVVLGLGRGVEGARVVVVVVVGTVVGAMVVEVVVVVVVGRGVGLDGDIVEGGDASEDVLVVASTGTSRL